MKRSFCQIILFVVLSLFICVSAQAADKQLNLGIMQWTTESLPSYIIKQVFEDRLGYKVKPEDMFEWGVSFAALSKGDIDIMTGEPSFVQNDYWDKSKDKLEIVSSIGFGLYQALAVPGYVSIDSTEELNEHKDKFDGKIIGIEAGSGLMRQTKDAVKAYNLELELIEGSTAAMNSALKSAIDKNKWIVVTSWTPTWWHQKYNIKFLKDPKGIYPEAVPQHMMATKGFSQQHPEAAKVLQALYIPLNDILLMSSWVKEGISVQEAAQRWCKENGKTIDRWMALANVK